MIPIDSMHYLLNNSLVSSGFYLNNYPINPYFFHAYEDTWQYKWNIECCQMFINHLQDLT
jgi:hypothetical protein